MEKRNNKIIFITVFVILLLTITLFFSIESKKQKAIIPNNTQDNSAEKPVEKEIDLTGYIDVTSDDNNGIFDNYLKNIARYFSERTVLEITPEDINSCAVYYYGYNKGILQEYVIKYGKDYFNIDNFTLKTGTYQLSNNKNTVTVSLKDDVYTIESDIDYSNSLKKKWNRISKVYQKEDKYIVIFEYITSTDVQFSKDTLYGNLAIYVTKNGESYNVNKVIFEPVKQ